MKNFKDYSIEVLIEENNTTDFHPALIKDLFKAEKNTVWSHGMTAKDFMHHITKVKNESASTN